MPTDTAAIPAARNLLEIEQSAERLRQRLDIAAQTVAEYQLEAGELRMRYSARIRRHAAEVRGARNALVRLIDTARSLFIRPKSRVLHGITCGLRAKPGQISWPDQETLIALVREHLPERADALIQSVERVEVSTLTPDDIAALGIQIPPTIDHVVCAEKGSEISATLDALLADLPQEAA